MVWYNPFSWFRTVNSYEKIELYCDNPQCRDQLIKKGPLYYDSEHHEIYHTGDCSLFAIAHRTKKSGEPVTSSVRQIDFDEASKLYRSGQLRQKS